MGKTLSEINELPFGDVALFIAYDRLSPIGYERFDMLSAQITSGILATAGSQATISDVVLRWHKTEKEEIEDAHKFFRSIRSS